MRSASAIVIGYFYDIKGCKNYYECKYYILVVVDFDQLSGGTGAPVRVTVLLLPFSDLFTLLASFSPFQMKKTLVKVLMK